MRISWRNPNALKGAAQRTLTTLKTPAGNIDWYKKWYERNCLRQLTISAPVGSAVLLACVKRLSKWFRKVSVRWPW